jgi:hypothetical protein
MEKPWYPADLRHLGSQVVRLRCTVLQDGEAAAVTYVSGPVQLLPYARAALAQWRFEPMRLYSPYTGRTDAVAFITSIDVPFYARWP